MLLVLLLKIVYWGLLMILVEKDIGKFCAVELRMEMFEKWMRMRNEEEYIFSYFKKSVCKGV